MSVFKRGDRWIAQIYQGGRTVHVGTFDLKREAKDAETAALTMEPRTTCPTVAMWRERWLAEFPRPKQSTNIVYKQQTKRVADTFGDRRLDDVTVLDARAHIRSHPTDLAGTRAMFTDARRAGLITGDNPFAGLGTKRSAGRRDLPSEWLTLTDVQHLADCAQRAAKNEAWAPTMRAAILFAAHTGLRPGELYGLQWADVHADHIEVRRTASETSRSLTLPKNGKQRIVPLAAPASDALSLITRFHGVPFVFCSPRGHQFWATSFHRYWNSARCLAGRPDMHLHELRHFCATWLLELGLAPADVAEQLGHDDNGALVMKLYGHPSKQAARARILAAANAAHTDGLAPLRKAQ